MLCPCLFVCQQTKFQGHAPPTGSWPRVVLVCLVITCHHHLRLSTLSNSTGNSHCYQSALFMEIWHLIQEMPLHSTCCGLAAGVVVDLLVRPTDSSSSGISALLKDHDVRQGSSHLSKHRSCSWTEIATTTKRMLKAVAFRNPKFLDACRASRPVWGDMSGLSKSQRCLSLRYSTSPLWDPVPQFARRGTPSRCTASCCSLALAFASAKINLSVTILASRLSRAVIAVPPSHRVHGFRYTRTL
jgi:hypothetical protein